MRRLLPLGIVAVVLYTCEVTVVGNARLIRSPSVLGRAQVETAFRRTGLTVLPNLGTLPRGEVMEYVFLVKRSDRVFGVYLVVYATVEEARRASVAIRQGVSTRRYFIPASKTLRVRNVLLVFQPKPKTNKGVEHALKAALSRLGKPISP